MTRGAAAKPGRGAVAMAFAPKTQTTPGVAVASGKVQTFVKQRNGERV
jgi:hypothetical protein